MDVFYVSHTFNCRSAIRTLVRLWRELLAGTTAMQGPFAIAVCEPDGGAGFTQAASDELALDDGQLRATRTKTDLAHPAKLSV